MGGTEGGRPRVVVFGDYTCPFSYLAEASLARLRAEGVETEYRAFELRPAPVPRLDPASEGLRRWWEEEVFPAARALGVEIRYPPGQPRTRKAHEAAAFAREQGRFLEMHEALFRAFFVEGRDIGRIDVLVEVGRDAGFDPAGLKVALDIDRYTERVLADEEEARALGITGTPTFLVGTERVVGLHPYDVLREWVLRGW